MAEDQIQAVIALVERPPLWRGANAARVAFELAARQYADANIAAIPLGGDDGKKPLVNGPQNFGVRASLKIAPKFSEANVGFWCGQRSGVTVVDIDDPSGRDLRWSLEEFGLSPIIVRTGSGKFHIWYRYNGEGRRIRPFRDRELDILGSGLVVAPPSVRPGRGSYEFIRGSLSDVRALPSVRRPMLELEEIEQAAPVLNEPCPQGITRASAATILEGRRNDALFRVALKLAVGTDTLDDLTSRLLQASDEVNSPPLGRDEVSRIAGSAWLYKQRGRLFVPGTQHVVLDGHALTLLSRGGNEDALMLYVRLLMAHEGRRDTFAASPKAMARDHVIGSWSPKRYRHALDALCLMGLLQRLSDGGRCVGDTAKYRLCDPGTAYASP